MGIWGAVRQGPVQCSGSDGLQRWAGPAASRATASPPATAPCLQRGDTDSPPFLLTPLELQDDIGVQEAWERPVI